MFDKTSWFVGEATPESERHRVVETAERAENFLRGELDVENLSDIEMVKLQELSEECLRENVKSTEEINNLMVELKQRGNGDVESKALEKRILNLVGLKFEPHKEAAVRWLDKLYHVPWDDIPRVDTIRDENGVVLCEHPAEKGEEISSTDNCDKRAGKFERMREMKERDERFMNEKARGFEHAGHKVTIEYGKVPDDFKEYLRRLRDESHLL